MYKLRLRNVERLVASEKGRDKFLAQGYELVKEQPVPAPAPEDPEKEEIEDEEPEAPAPEVKKPNSKKGGK